MIYSDAMQAGTEAGSNLSLTVLLPPQWVVPRLAVALGDTPGLSVVVGEGQQVLGIVVEPHCTTWPLGAGTAS